MARIYDYKDTEVSLGWMIVFHLERLFQSILIYAVAFKILFWM